MKGKIFNAQEVQAMLNGSKVMFREVIKPQPNSNINPVKLDYLQRTWQWATKESRRECPYQVGQKIFCKESFSSYYEDDGLVRGDIFLYRADEDSKELEDVDWKPAQQMKQEHSRLTLLIKEIRVERLADISEEDCIKEGIEKMWLEENEDFPRYTFGKHSFFEVKKVFRDWWNATHKKPEEKFEANPFCWVVSFEVINN